MGNAPGRRPAVGMGEHGSEGCIAPDQALRGGYSFGAPMCSHRRMEALAQYMTAATREQPIGEFEWLWSTW